MKMKTVKITDLEGAALDWLVADIEGYGPYLSGYGSFSTKKEYTGWSEGSAYSPSTDWSQGGPLIEEYGIAVAWDWTGDDGGKRGMAGICKEGLDPGGDLILEFVGGACWHAGPTLLIAAMRVLVASKLRDRDTVAVPAELVP